MEKNYSFYRRAYDMIEAGIECSGIDTLYKAVSKMFDCDLVFADQLLCPIAYPRELIPDASWEDLSDLDLVPDSDWIADLQNCRCIMQKGGCRLYNWPSEKNDNSHFLIDIERNGKKQAYLSVVVRTAANITLEEKELLLLLAGIFSIHFDSRTGHTIDNSAFEYYITALIEDCLDRDAEKALFRDTDLRSNGYYTLVLIDMKHRDVMQQGLHSFRTVVEQSLHVTKSALYDDCIVILLSAQDPAAAESRNYVQLERTLEKNGAYAAISRMFSNIWMLHDYYTGTKKILSLKTAAPPGTRVLSAENMSIVFVLEALLRTERPESLVDPRVRKLVKYDQENGTEYVKTLFAYLQYAKKISSTCEKMHIHRNTLDYRLKKISEIAGIDWNDGDLHFRLYLSLKALGFVAHEGIEPNF